MYMYIDQRMGHANTFCLHKHVGFNKNVMLKNSAKFSNKLKQLSQLIPKIEKRRTSG